MSDNFNLHPLESLNRNEEQSTQNLTSQLRAKMEREPAESGAILRDAHPKQHGLVRAKFEVNSDIPARLKVGIFKEAKTFDCWIRFSNQNAPIKADIDKDIRGMAIKIIGVEGERLLEADQHSITQDFITISTDVFVTKDVEQFDKLINKLISGKLSLMWFLLWNWRVTKNLLSANRKFTSPLNIEYFSTTPYLLGAAAVKYSIKPCQNSALTIPSPAKYSYLKDVMVKQLSDKDMSFDFMVQERTDPKNMPIEDPGQLWSTKVSPYIKMATITLPKQQFDCEAQHQYGNNLSFNPWHGLKEHRPLGGINRARRIIYQTLSAFRHKKNNKVMAEPTEMLFFDE